MSVCIHVARIHTYTWSDTHSYTERMNKTNVEKPPCSDRTLNTMPWSVLRRFTSSPPRIHVNMFRLHARGRGRSFSALSRRHNRQSNQCKYIVCPDQFNRGVDKTHCSHVGQASAPPHSVKLKRTKEKNIV